DERSQKRYEVARMNIPPETRLVVGEKFQNALIIFLWIINGRKNLLVTFDEFGGVHFGNVIEIVAGVASLAFRKQSSFTHEAPRKLRSRESRKNPDHRYGNCGLLDEIDHAIKNIRWVFVKSNNKSAQHFQPSPLNLADRFQQIHAGILHLL